MADGTKRPSPEKDAKTGRFVTGNNGGGRPKGARNRLGDAFVADLLEDWEDNGKAAIQQVRTERPQDYLKVVASILPKDVNVNVRPFEEMDDDQLRKHAEQLITELGPVAAFASGGDSERAENPASRKSLN